MIDGDTNQVTEPGWLRSSSSASAIPSSPAGQPTADDDVVNVAPPLSTPCHPTFPTLPDSGLRGPARTSCFDEHIVSDEAMMTFSCLRA